MNSIPKMTMLVLLTFAATACGYSLLLSGDGDRGRVVVPMAKNATPFPSLASPLTGAIRARLGSWGVEVIRGGEAPVLSVSIETAGDAPGMVSVQRGALVPEDVEWTLVVTYSLVAPGGEELISEARAEARERALATGGAMGEEAGGARARSEALDRIAEEIATEVLRALEQ